MVDRVRPLVVDEEFFFAVLARGATRVQIVARGVDEAAVLAAGERFLSGLPRSERGRFLVGNCERGVSRRELVAQVGEALRMMPPPSWAS